MRAGVFALQLRRRRNSYVKLLGGFAGAEKIRFRKHAASGYLSLTGFGTVRFSSTIFVLRDCRGITVEINARFYFLPPLLQTTTRSAVVAATGLASAVIDSQ